MRNLWRAFGAGSITVLVFAWGAASSVSGQGGSADGLWQPAITPTADPAAGAPRPVPSQARAFQLDAGRMSDTLRTASRALDERAARITLPLPDGRYVALRVYETMVMEPELAATVGNFRTFRGVGVEDPTVIARIEYGDDGLRAVINTREGRFFVEPSRAPEQPHLAFPASRGVAPGAQLPPPRCQVTSEQASSDRARDVAARAGRTPAPDPPGATLRVYRLAMAATGEYTRFHGGTVVSASRAIASTVNRVNEVFEADLGVSFRLIAGNGQLVHADGATDPYTNDNATALLRENQEQIDAKIGASNYDIGHVLSTGAGGLARLDAVCAEDVKARGATGKAEPTGDPFDIDYVAHEIGHQMGANHTFNATTGSCGGGNRHAATAFEPGSGSTVMGYAGICGQADLQPNSHSYFHAGSLDEIRTFVTAGGGSTCGTRTTTGNTPPVVTLDRSSVVVPKATPFRLAGRAVDASPSLMYVWEEMDLGPSAPPDEDADGRLRPLFRSYRPDIDSSRQFPRAEVLLSGTTPPAGERLPAVARSLRFRLTARDYADPAGGFGHAEVTVSVASSGPLRVTAPAARASWPAGSAQTVKWTVNNTNRGDVNCQQVRVLLSPDGGRAWPTVLLASTANDGREVVQLPPAAADQPQARIMVECTTSPFFNVSGLFGVTAAPLSTRAGSGVRE
jgi:hypothetical protein